MAGAPPRTGRDVSSLHQTSTTGALRPAPPAALSRARELIVREAALIVTCACVAIIFLTNLGVQIAADSWLNLLGGREILNHGIPHHDTLAVLSRGREWIDQQWLANLAYYGLYALGGLGLAARVNIFLFVATLALVFVFARRRGATSLSVMLAAIPMCVVGLEFIRAQVLTEPLFVLLLALLVSESRHPTRRAFLAFPLLVLWANIHGSVVLGAALVALLGVVEAVKARRSGLLRPALLTLLPWPCIFASPYGLHLTSYYSSTLHNPVFPKYLTEWAPPPPLSIWGIPLFALAAVGIFLVGRHSHAWTAFEKGAFALTLVGGLLAVRSIPWFTITGALLLPTLLDLERRGKPVTSTERQRAVALGGVAISLLLVVHGLASPGNSTATDWPDGATTQVTNVLRADPSARVLATYELADWILFRVPEARGRIAFDGRWEILPPSQFRKIMDFHGHRNLSAGHVARGYRLLVIDPQGERALARTFEHQPGARVLFRGSRVVVIDRGRGADRSPRSG
jgi:hypothetical protein